MKLSHGYASSSIYMYIKFEYTRRTEKMNEVNFQQHYLDSNVSHKLYKNERSKLGETKYFGRYDEEAFQQNLIFFTTDFCHKIFVFRSNSNRSYCSFK